VEDDKRRALRALRSIGEAVLLRVGEPMLVGQVQYILESRFVSVVGSCEIQSRGPVRIKVQYPLWNFLTEEEKYSLVAHEHCHLAAWKQFGSKIDPHGLEWRQMMSFVGYPNASDRTVLSPAAQAHANQKRGTKVSRPGPNDKATLWVKDGYIFCKSPYNQEFVQELKADIPGGCRVFMPIDKVWRVAAAYHEDLLSVVRKHYGEPTILEPETTVTVVESTGKDPFGEMLRVAPPELMKKIYRLIAAEIHPDKGGKPEDMITLNAAWTEVKKEKGL